MWVQFFAKMYQRNFNMGLIMMMLSVAFVSAFINNTPIVALFIPIIIQTAREAKLSPGKLLMPLSYSAIFGGMCTLIGTSTNILVDGIARQHGETGFNMFTLTPIGLTISVGGILYMVFIREKASA
jgi:Na+/H+ antiporter NhaD/arsenite permease-like protein